MKPPSSNAVMLTQLSDATTPQARELAQAKIDLLMAATPEQRTLAQAYIDLATPATTPEKRSLAQAQIDLAYAQAKRAEIEKGPEVSAQLSKP